MLQVPETMCSDETVVPKESSALGEWALTITRSEVWSGPKTMHCISFFLQLVRSLSQVAGCSFDR